MRKLASNVLLILGIAMLSVASFGAVGFQSMPLLRGTNLKLYIGTADTATTFSDTDTYATNRTYVNLSGTTVTPLSTNSVSGALVPSFARPVPLFALTTGAAQTNVSIGLTFTGVAALTNTVTVYIARSVNGGTDYDTGQPFSFVITPDSTNAVTTSTNLPLDILSGSSHLKISKIVTGANETDNANITINRINVGTFGN